MLYNVGPHHYRRPMAAPAFSTFSAIAEIFVTIGVFTVVLTNFRGKTFLWWLAAFLIVFEFSVNMLYMIVRAKAVSGTGEFSDGMMAFAATHGLLSLLVFVLFVVFSFMALMAWRKGQFFFQERPRLTFAFLALWTASVVSGEVLYVLHYGLPGVA